MNKISIKLGDSNMKYALVTGGSRGIGNAICIGLAEEGCHVIINYLHNEDAAKQTLQAVTERGGTGELLRFDVADRAEVEKVLGGWIEQNKDKFVEVLVNNAGIRKDQLLPFMKDEEWDSVLNTNLNSFFFVTRQLVKPMVAKRYGRIVNIVSLSGVKGLAGQTNYSAAKAGVIGATKALAQELGKRNITVNAVAPGFIKTDMTEGFDEKDYKQHIPAQRFGKPEEVANAVVFLASEKASYITGEVLHVNGGLYT